MSNNNNNVGGGKGSFGERVVLRQAGNSLIPRVDKHNISKNNRRRRLQNNTTILQQRFDAMLNRNFVDFFQEAPDICESIEQMSNIRSVDPTARVLGDQLWFIFEKAILEQEASSFLFKMIRNTDLQNEIDKNVLLNKTKIIYNDIHYLWSTIEINYPTTHNSSKDENNNNEDDYDVKKIIQEIEQHMQEVEETAATLVSLTGPKVPVGILIYYYLRAIEYIRGADQYLCKKNKTSLIWFLNKQHKIFNAKVRLFETFGYTDGEMNQEFWTRTRQILNTYKSLLIKIIIGFSQHENVVKMNKQAEFKQDLETLAVKRSLALLDTKFYRLHNPNADVILNANNSYDFLEFASKLLQKTFNL